MEGCLLIFWLKTRHLLWVDDIFVCVWIGFAFVNPLKFFLWLSVKCALSSYYGSPEIQNNIQDKCLRKMLGLQLDKLVKEMVF